MPIASTLVEGNSWLTALGRLSMRSMRASALDPQIPVE